MTLKRHMIDFSFFFDSNSSQILHLRKKKFCGQKISKIEFFAKKN